jgi:hypothetical protein
MIAPSQADLREEPPNSSPVNIWLRSGWVGSGYPYFLLPSLLSSLKIIGGSKSLEEIGQFFYNTSSDVLITAAAASCGGNCSIL